MSTKKNKIEKKKSVFFYELVVLLLKGGFKLKQDGDDFFEWNVKNDTHLESVSVFLFELVLVLEQIRSQVLDGIRWSFFGEHAHALE